MSRLLISALTSAAVAAATLAIAPAVIVSAASADVTINEVESNGGSPGDWVELYNAGSGPVDISGFKFRDNDAGHAFYSIPSNTIIAAGGFYVLDEADFGFGLGGADSANLFAANGTTAIDSYTWASHAAITFSRCADGLGAFVQSASTKGALNACGAPTTTTAPPGPSTTVSSGFLPWPGAATVQTVDLASTFTSNLSGLEYEGSGSSTPGVIWAARNGVGSIFKMVFDGANWVPASTDGWSAGKAVKYPSGTGEPDAEGITFGGPTPSDGLYIGSERNNSSNSTSRNSILRYNATSAGTTLTATNEWNLTTDLPVTGANLGIEAITWIPDAFLVSKGFLDESKSHLYAPSEYANHGNGLFFVGLEATGGIYAYALDHVGGGFTRVATISSGFAGVMDLQFDRDLNDLWAVCDDTCNGRSAILRINPTTGTFGVSFAFERPAGLPNTNNEGFTIASAAECVSGLKPAFWSDDNDLDTFSIRRGSVPCAAFGVAPPTDVAEFPAYAIPSIIALVLLGGFVALSRRRPLTAIG